MIEIEINLADGSIQRLTVAKVEFVKVCPHCDLEFQTHDPDQRYPDSSHKARAYEIRRVMRDVTNSVTHP